MKIRLINKRPPDQFWQNSVHFNFNSTFDVFVLPLSDASTAVQKLKTADVNVLAGLVKLFFRNLPESLFTDALYSSLAEGIGGMAEIIKLTLYLVIVFIVVIRYLH